MTGEAKRFLILELVKKSQCFTSDKYDWEFTGWGVKVRQKEQKFTQLFPWNNIVTVMETEKEK